MTASIFDRRFTIAALLALGTPLAACSSDVGVGDVERAYLTIEGSRSVILPYDGTSRLAVRYHDEADRPLAGRIDFEVVGDARGSTLSQSSADADGSGIVEISIRAARADISFRVRASAADAAPVEWTINVNQSGTMDVTGSYALSSRFDVVSGMPGKVGEVVNTFIDMTDGPYDPASFVLDKLGDQIGGVGRSAINALRPGLDALVNEVILSNAPDIIQRLLEVGDALGQASRKLGIESTLVVSRNGAAWKSNHLIAAYGFQIDGQAYTYAPGEIGAEPTEVKDLAITLAGDKMTIAEHTMPLRYGALLGAALEDIIIPEVDPFASSIAELLLNAVNCNQIGAEIAFRLGFGSPSFYAGACVLGINAAGNAAMNKLRSIDDSSPVSFIMTGNAKVRDSNGDLKADEVVNGKWTGNIDYNGTQVVLPEAATFIGERM
jgi:hypothetical protein